MKPRILITLLTLFLFNSCIVKSLFPFFTEDTIHFEETLLGNWKDLDDEEWHIFSMDSLVKKDKNKNEPFSDDDKQLLKTHSNSYMVFYSKKNILSLFVATPFKINNQIFIDFFPLEYNDKNELVTYHLIPTHSLAKIDLINENNFEIKWLSSEKMSDLLKSNKIKIKHERVGHAALSEKILLTASSIELQKFIKKYMLSDDKDKWKTDVEFNLKKSNKKSDFLVLLKALENQIDNKIKFN